MTLLVSKKGFTLIEMLIVMSIIGILATVAFPRVTGYFERARVVEYQNLASELIKTAKMYNNEVGYISNPGEGPTGDYAYTLCEIPWCDPWYELVDFSAYITKNNPSIWRKEAKLIDWWPWWRVISYQSVHLPTYQSYWYTIPGRDMTSNQKVGMIIWFLLWYSEDLSIWQSLQISWNNMPVAANKKCSPWFALLIENDPPFVRIHCGYLLD